MKKLKKGYVVVKFANNATVTVPADDVYTTDKYVRLKYNGRKYLYANWYVLNAGDL